MPTLKNANSWKIWRGEPVPAENERGEPIQSSEHYQPALFLYCALNGAL